MNTIQNYGMTNCKLSFKSKNTKLCLKKVGEKIIDANHNNVAMVGNKAVIVRSDLVKANPVFKPHIPFATQPIDVTNVIKGVKDPVLTLSYLKKTI